MLKEKVHEAIDRVTKWMSKDLLIRKNCNAIVYKYTARAFYFKDRTISDVFRIP